MINKILQIISICLISIFILLIVNSWCWADDFGMYNNIQKSGGVFESLIWGYFNWDGRYLSILSILQALLLKLHYAELAVTVWGVAFCFLILFLVKNLFFANYFKWYHIVIFGSFIFHGAREVLGETLFWITGGTYTFITFILLYWIYKLNLVLEFSKNKKLFFEFLLLTIICAQGGPQICSAMFIGLISSLFLYDKIFYKKKWFYKTHFIILFIICVCALIVILAPGNNSRFNKMEKVNIELSIQNLLLNFVHVINTYFYFNKYLYLNLFIIYLPISFVIRDSIDEFMIKMKSNFSKNIVFLIISFSSTLPFIVYPDFAAPRTSMLFSFFLILFISPYIILFYKFIFKDFKFNINKNTSYLLIFLTMPLVFIGISWVNRSIISKDKINSRYEYIEKFRDSKIDLKVVKLDLDLPQIKVFQDIQDDTSHYINHDMAEYYGLKSIGYIENTKNDKK